MDARHNSQNYIPAWPNNLTPNFQACTQINRVEKDPFDLITPQNSGFTSFNSNQDWYQQHRQFVLSNIIGISLQGKTVKITPEDIGLINRICADNPHKSPEALRTQLSQSSTFNYAQHFLKGDNLLHAFTPDVFIDSAHFKQISASDYRVKKMIDSAQQAMQDRHKREKSQLESTHKEQLKTAKKKSKIEENKVASCHKKEWADLNARHDQEKKHPLGIKQPKKPISASSQSQITPVTKKSNITPQKIKNLRESNDNQALKLPRDQDNSFQQVMDKRSKSFESSINSLALTVENIKINSQTTAFLQAQGIDTTQFQQVEGLPIQHQLTHELVDVLDAVADYAQQHHYEIYQTHLTKYCAHLASLSQQSNLEGTLEQAIDGTNCCHGIEHYLKGMVSSIGQAYQQFQTALDYFDVVADTYGNLIVQHAAQGAMVAHGLEAIVTVGMIVAPTVTVAATGIMIGATAYIMAPICFQALMDLNHFGSACILGDWNKVTKDLDNFGTFISKSETVARMAELAGGAAMPTPNLSCVVEQVLSLRPVITSVQNASGEMVQSLYLMTKNKLQKVYTQGLELLQLPEFANFNMNFEKIWGSYFFHILPQSHPALAGAFSGLESGVMSSAEQAALTQLFTQAEGSVVGNVITSGASSIGSQAAQGVLPKDFTVTEVGKRMLQVITKPYEEVMFKNVIKDYSKLISNQASKETIELFCRCHEISIVPQKISTDIERLHTIFKDKYLGLQEFSSENPYLTMQMRHIFYPSLQPKLNKNHQNIDRYILNGFHHDEYATLEQSGLFKFINKVDSKNFFMADLDFGNDIICKEKTFFSSQWSREKTVQIIFEASQNIIEDMTEIGDPNKQFLCRSSNGLFIEIIINLKNRIISAYPSLKNFGK